MIMNRFQHEKPTYILVNKMKYMFSSAWGSVLGKTTLKTEDTVFPNADWPSLVITSFRKNPNDLGL